MLDGTSHDVTVEVLLDRAHGWRDNAFVEVSDFEERAINHIVRA